MGLKGVLDQLLGRSRNIVGLDIGHDSVKVVELSGAPDNIELVRYGIAPVSQPKGREAAGEDFTATLDAVQRVLSESGIQGGQVCTAVSGESVIVRPIPMPAFATKSEEEFRTAVRSEAKDFIPFEMDDVVFDYQRLGEKASREGGRSIEVLIVAVKKELIDRHLALLDQAGLEPVVIDVDSISLVNAVIAGSNIDPSEAIAVVNIGSNVTNIAIMRNEMTRFTRDLAFAGRNISQSVASEFELPIEEAEELKRRCGLSFLSGMTTDEIGEGPTAQQDLGVVQDLYQAIESLKTEEESSPDEAENSGNQERRVSEICEQVIGDIVSEVKRSLLYYENQLDGEPISRVILSGGTAKLKGIQEYFESVLDVPTELVQPLQHIKSTLSPEEVADQGPLLGVGLGLALRNVIKS